MFQQNKINHQVTATCTDGVNTATYTFIESWDDNWYKIAAEKFLEEFGTEPTNIKRVSYDGV
ncbi:hypothetical protein [Acholeplasma laidlawii]|uniref:hypothetical protein n=1 Tax=Acholeplasma laidlawii TaxID=2148 RepID=UPI0025419D86|nr:hypothetical protein QOL21_07625 [Acholeplasma laidlawii]